MKKIIFLFAAAVSLCLTACAQSQPKQENMMAIEPVQPYTSADLDWTNNQSRSTLEMKNPKSRPAIKTPEKSLEAYDVVFIGYPIWWDLAPTVVNTFIESQQLEGKMVVPFATSGGSSISNSAAQLISQHQVERGQTAQRTIG